MKIRIDANEYDTPISRSGFGSLDSLTGQQILRLAGKDSKDWSLYIDRLPDQQSQYLRTEVCPWETIDLSYWLAEEFYGRFLTTKKPTLQG